MWTFSQSSGKITSPDGSIAGLAYSGGNCGANPDGVNNPDMETVKCVGPLPVGIYSMAGPENSSKLGPFAIPLIPDETNVMYGRGGFYVHGDNSKMNQSASEGCIIAARNIREAMWSSPDHQIQVVR